MVKVKVPNEKPNSKLTKLDRKQLGLTNFSKVPFVEDVLVSWIIIFVVISTILISTIAIIF